MYCTRCRVHFSGQRGRTCPYCGGEAEDSKAETGSVDAAPSGGAPGGREPVERERTRTEAAERELWEPGTVIAGKYEVVSRLGSGGFGTVYKVRHLFRKKYYALKAPHPEFARDDVFLRRFEREIEAMERFVHSDAVMARDSGVTEDGRPYYTMDFIEGESLKAVLRREGKLPVERALHVASCVLKVLEAAHAHQIVHRDIKPDNILLTRVGGREAVKVLDFGVAKLLDLVGDSKSITGGARVGTPKYMSPEQITGEPVDAR
ncbi:MAG: serine/threonine protein kinase, partial [Planctomycetes bacterium]|nr:serine/threonine protein kinase [Planctomycetota bacterium]